MGYLLLRRSERAPFTCQTTHIHTHCLQCVDTLTDRHSLHNPLQKYNSLILYTYGNVVASRFDIVVRGLVGWGVRA